MVDDTDDNDIVSDSSPTDEKDSAGKSHEQSPPTDHASSTSHEDEAEHLDIASIDLDALYGDTTEDPVHTEKEVNSTSEDPHSDDSSQVPEVSAPTIQRKTFSNKAIDALLFGFDVEEEEVIEPETPDVQSLLNFEMPQTAPLRGMDAILKKTQIYYERLPMLEVVFDRLIRLLSTNLRNFTSDNVEINMESSKTIRFGDYLNSIPLPTMLCVFTADEWENQGLFVVDSSLIYAIVDVLLGGRHSNLGLNSDGRTFTTIECNLIEKLMCVLLEDLSTAFEPISPVKFTFDRLELNPHFAMIARTSNAGILLKLGVDIDDRYGKISLFLPYATIEPIRELLLQNFMGEKFGRDSIWEQHLIAELKETDVTFDIHLVTEMVQLTNILNWKIGDSILFNSTPQTLVTAKSGERALFRGVVGHKNGKVAIKIKENLLDKNEYVTGDEI